MTARDDCHALTPDGGCINQGGPCLICPRRQVTPFGGLDPESAVTQPCWHCDGTGRLAHCAHEWMTLAERGIQMCWLCGKPEDIPAWPRERTDTNTLADDTRKADA